jgi:hypothetical protein
MPPAPAGWVEAPVDDTMLEDDDNFADDEDALGFIDKQRACSRRLRPCAAARFTASS